MSDPNLKWIKTLIQARDTSKNKIKVNKKELSNIQMKLLKYLTNLKTIKKLIYLVDEDKFGNKRRIASQNWCLCLRQGLLCSLPWICISGQRYVLAICDHYTKNIEVFSMKTQTALEVEEKCLDYCLMFGIPEAVLTDQDSNSTSQVIESLWEGLDVQRLRTTAYHPQTDGIPERFNRTIKIMLTQFVLDHCQDDKLSFGYNTAVYAVSKFSPFELMFGRIPNRQSIWFMTKLIKTNLRQTLKLIGSPPTSWISKRRRC